MRVLRPVLSVLVALVLLTQSGLAAAHCLAMASPAGHETVICSPEGVRTVRIGGDGGVLDEAPRHGGGGFCAACPLPVAALPDRPVAMALPDAGDPPPSPVAAATLALRPPARAPPYASRAPPIPA